MSSTPRKTKTTARKTPPKEGASKGSKPSKTSRTSGTSKKATESAAPGAAASQAIALFQVPGAAGAEVDEGFAPYTPGASTAGSALWGLLPTGFAAASGWGGHELRAAIEQRPGFDCYYGSLAPAHEALFHNAWAQAEAAHPGFMALSAEVLQACGLPPTVPQAMCPASLFTNGSNVGSSRGGQFMVATSAFWAAWQAFASQVFSTAQAKVGKTTRAALWESGPAGDKLRALMQERLLSVFFLMKDSPWKATKLPLPKLEAALNPHLRLLREMKDQAINQRSHWLADAWLNYRNLFLLQTQGEAWVRQHLKAITPPVLHSAAPVAALTYAYPRQERTPAP
jgi:hypothetical protein